MENDTLRMPIPFTVYNASAGSGKTYTLVKEYLSTVLSSENPGYYRNLLAITFTNKAVAEMKQRIVANLVAFAEDKLTHSATTMRDQIAKEKKLSPSEIQQRARAILTHLLHHYAGFNVETIDRFNHQLLRTFARDLKLSTNFEVSLEVEALLVEAVDRLVSKAGTDAEITKTLLEYALEKTDDDKSWDIARDIAKAAKLLTQETDAPFLAQLKQHSLKDFRKFKHGLLKQREEITEKLKETAREVLELLAASGLTPEHFNRKLLPNYFEKIAAGEQGTHLYGAKWQETIEETPLYPSRVKPPESTVIDCLAPQLSRAFLTTKAWVYRIALIDNILGNLTPLSVVTLVQRELDAIKTEHNILPISEFNALINAEIKGQPAPFIYERLGERYRHFFIDEHQDTSQLQWENLIPLIANALSQNDGEPASLLVVGDAKQSIYRWRGGLPEQFMGLYGTENPFHVPKVVLNLGTNFRSASEIVSFNNEFFRHIARYFGSSGHQQLYDAGTQQKPNTQEGGYVQLEFLEKENAEQLEEAYATRIVETITELKEEGYSEADLCILTRKRKEGVLISEALLARGIAVVSSETLLIQNAPIVQFLVAVVTLTVYPDTDAAKIHIIDFLHRKGVLSGEKHLLFTACISKSHHWLSQLFQDHGCAFSFERASKLPLYPLLEYAIENFDLQTHGNAFLFGFMDFVFDYVQTPQASILGFLEHWETQREKASLAIGEGVPAVQVMTIHKAKGLEFLVVLYPYANTGIYSEVEPKTWFTTNLGPDSINPMLLNYNRDLAELGEEGYELYTSRRNTLELDSYNLLYVTLTRAVERLYIFSEKPKPIQNSEPTQFSQLFRSYLEDRNEWEDTKTVYSRGIRSTPQQDGTRGSEAVELPKYLVSPPESHDLAIVTKEGLLWGQEAQVALAAGTLFHDTMATIHYKTDMKTVFSRMAQRGTVAPSELDSLKQTVHRVVSHKELAPLFEIGDVIFNEKDIITSSGRLLRPDRINIHIDKSVTVIDYKTGHPNSSHANQLKEYAESLEDMGYFTRQLLLVYVNDREIVVNKV